MKTHLRHLPKASTFVAASLSLCLAACVFDDSEPPPSCDARVNDTPAKLLECVTTAGVRAHLVALNDITVANGGTRVSGTRGFNAAFDYARKTLVDAGYAVTVQPFEVKSFVVLSPGVLEQRSPAVEVIANDTFTYSGSGDVTATVGVPAVPTGCVATEFSNFVPGRIALIRRGDCTFFTKAQNAASAGASGVVFYNNVDAPSGGGTLGSASTLTLPVLGITRDAGMRLAALVPQGLVMRVKADTRVLDETTYNLLAESTTGRDDAVIMAGAHLDTVNGTVGMDDNGSGVAGVLETARQLSRVRPLNKLRFAIWGAEETGLEGSAYYVLHLSPAERARVALYLNFDMIASPNYGIFIADSDGANASDGVARPPGSALIRSTFADYYRARNIPTKTMIIDGSTDQWPFFAAGIPVGGVFTGYLDLKTDEEAALWGGTAGKAFDACYHQPCDNLGNVNEFALGLNAGAIAWATLSLASTPWTYPSTASGGKSALQELPVARFRGAY